MNADQGEDHAREVEGAVGAAGRGWPALRAAVLDALPASSGPRGSLKVDVRFEDGSAKTVSIAPLHTLGLHLLEFRCDVCHADQLSLDAALAMNLTLAIPALALADGRYLLRYSALAESLDAHAVAGIVRVLASSADIIAHPPPAPR